MKHFTLLTNKRHILLVLIMLLCSVRVAYADDSGLVTQQITVNVPTAGTLSNIIQSDKMYKITNLKITGSLNADDIRFIRKMAGCYYNGNGSKYDGHLQYLDLGSLSQISYVHSFEVYDENGYRSTLNDCLFPLAYLYNLKTVVLPNLYKDYNFSLMGCRNLTTAKMPDNLEKIGNNTFKDCRSLEDIRISPTVTSIGEYAFSGCSSLTEIQIPNNVTYIGKYAFHGCSSLKYISIPEGLKNISASTFEDCVNLQSFGNYNCIESIGDRAFAGCSKLSWLPNIFYGAQFTSISIGTYVFENCKSLKSMWLPGNMKTLPRGMFKGCSSLSSVTLPQYLLSIDDYAFDGCSSLVDIKLPIYLNSLGYRALADCSKLTSLDLPSSLQNIGSYAFAGCNAMERIDANMAAPITASQSTFNGVDFSNCYLYVPTGAYQSYWLANGWGSFEHIIDNLAPQKSKMVTLETAGTLRDKIGSNEKFSITHLKVSGPINTNDIQYIREMAGCYYDTNGSKYNAYLHHLDLRDASYSGDGPMIEVYGPNGYKYYMYIQAQENAVRTTHLFFCLDGLQTVILPNNEEEIGETMFGLCNNLKNIEMSRVQTIRFDAFEGCSSLEALQLPYGITSLEDAVFADCSSLKEINIPSSVTTICDWAFENCRSLTSITIPDNVTSIGKSAFSGCNKLESFYFKGGVPTTLSEALIPTTCIIYVPTEYLQDYKDALGADYKYVYTWNPNGSGEEDKPVTKCATPTVSYESGELKFACETVGAKYHYTISDKDMATDAYSENGEVGLSAAYEISVYATADGYSASEKAQATLYWLNANLKDATNINMAKTRGVVASAHDGIVSVSGLDNGEEVKFYAADGKFIGQAVAANGTASYAVSEALVIAKVGNNSIKIAMK